MREFLKEQNLFIKEILQSIISSPFIKKVVGMMCPSSQSHFRFLFVLFEIKLCSLSFLACNKVNNLMNIFNNKVNYDEIIL